MKSIDLDLVERERLQQGQRRIASTEVVHRDPHAEILESPQSRHRPAEIADQDALGNFQFESRR